MCNINIEKKFIESLQNGYKNYLTVHPRSNSKIEPIHKCLAEILQSKLGEDFVIKSLGYNDNKEYLFQGKYYDKNIDIAILYNNEPISGLGFKFITSNYKQNSNNYFENMLGETANIKRNSLLYGQMIILKEKMPYYSRDKKKYTKIEIINELNLIKYFKLGNDNYDNLFHKPDIMFIAFIKAGDEDKIDDIIKNNEKINNISEFRQELSNNIKVEIIPTNNLKQNFSNDVKDFLIKHGDFSKFIDSFVKSTQARTYGR